MNMKSESLQLSAILDDASAKGVAAALQSVNGVSKYTISVDSIAVDFDENVTSTQELRTALQRTGIALKKPAHGEAGMCCGSCGS
jgi:CCGSCS motif protein